MFIWDLCFFFSLIFLLEDSCFIVLCWFLPYISMSKPQVYLCPLPLEPPSHSPPLWVVTQHWAELPVSHSNFPPALSFTYGRVYVSMLPSQFVPPSPSHCVQTSVLYVCISTAALQIGSSVPIPPFRFHTGHLFL